MPIHFDFMDLCLFLRLFVSLAESCSMTSGASSTSLSLAGYNKSCVPGTWTVDSQGETIASLSGAGEMTGMYDGNYTEAVGSNVAPIHSLLSSCSASLGSASAPRIAVRISIAS